MKLDPEEDWQAPGPYAAPSGCVWVVVAGLVSLGIWWAVYRVILWAADWWVG